MLGCIHPMSSPMMKRMLGFCPCGCCCCWAEVGMLAIVVTPHAKARAHQIALNLLMVAVLDPAADARAAAFARLHPPTVWLRRSVQDDILANRSAAPRMEKWSKRPGRAIRFRRIEARVTCVVSAGSHGVGQ